MLGKLRMVENEAAKFGGDPWYWFCKVQDGPYGSEEYWLVTEEEAIRFEQRAVANPEEAPPRRRGVYGLVENQRARFGAASEYNVLHVATREKPYIPWMLTPHDLARLQERTSKNREDIEANRGGWLADLFD